MRIEPASRENVFTVAENMRERDYVEFGALSFASTRAALALVMAERYGGRPDVMCGYFMDVPVCIGGAIETRPNVITLLFFATDDFNRVAFPATRFIRGEMFPRLRDAGVHRIEAVSLANHADAHKWLRVLGLEAETLPLAGYGKAGEEFIQFSWVRDVRPACA